MSGHKPKIPRVIAGIAMHTLPLDPMEGFVLSRIDATATVSDIADLTSLDVTEVQRIIDKLMGLGAVEWADGAVHLPRMSARSVAPPRPSINAMPRASQAPPAKVSEVHSSAPPRDVAAQRAAVRVIAAPRVPTVDAPPVAATPAPEMPSDGIELALDRRKRIDDLYVAIDLLDHYAVLGISQKASKAEVRSAYFELSKVFHPDTAFRKNVGTYRTKMETIFKKLTEAYEVLGKKKARDEYDAYLASIGETRDVEEAISVEKEIPPELLSPPPAPAPSPPPAPLPARSTPTDEGKRVARELLQKRMGAMRAATASSPSSEVTSPGVETAPAAERTKKDVLRDLTSSLRATASHTGGLDRVARLLADGQHAEEQRDLAAAVRAYRLAMALAPERVEIAEGHERLARELAVSLAPQYETQAAYEEKHQKWSAAATSWGKVVEGRPDDPKALVRAAIMLVEAKGDLHMARKFAQHAVDVSPDDIGTHFALGRVFHAAGLWLNAKRELEIVRRMEPSHSQAASLLKDIATHV